MKKLKHNKLKNTGLLFEILSRMVMHETLSTESKSPAIRIIKRHFKPESELLRELRLYQTLCNRSNHDAKDLVELSLQSHQSLDSKKLFQEKYDLVKSIKKNYNEVVFFDTRVTNYKLTASVYKLFEYNGKDNPDEYLTSKNLVLEHVSGKEVIEEDEVAQILREQDSDVRKLTLRLIVEKFNEKYRELNRKQKTLLGKFINQNVNDDEFKEYVFKETNYIVKVLSEIAKKRVTDDVTRIKLNETINLAQTIISSKIIKDEHLSALLKYYELIEEFEK